MNNHDTPDPSDIDPEFEDDFEMDDDPDLDDGLDADPDDDLPAGPPHPVNWYLLRAKELKSEWYELNRWVEKTRRTYALPASVIPPFWHRHPELVWELSALHIHFLCAYDPEQDGSAPHGWHRDFAETRQRLRDWVAASGTRLDRDRPSRQTTWPGEEPADPIEDIFVADRDRDFVEFVAEQVAARKAAEDAYFAGVDPETGELL